MIRLQKYILFICNKKINYIYWKYFVLIVLYKCCKGKIYVVYIFFEYKCIVIFFIQKVIFLKEICFNCYEEDYFIKYICNVCKMRLCIDCFFVY